MPGADDLDHEKRRLILSLETSRNETQREAAADKLDQTRHQGARVRQASDGLDTSRQAVAQGPGCGAEAVPSSLPPSAPESTEGEVARLRHELREARRTCALLEEELQHLERKALKAIVEAGELRRRLDERGQQRRLPLATSWSERALAKERSELEQRMAARDEERTLLLRALVDSEREIGRLTKALDLVVRKLRVA